MIALTLPGKSLFSPPRPRLPAIQPAPPPPPERTDPLVAAGGEKARKEELRRRGRRSLFTGTAAGVTDEATLGRPAATLGG